MFSQAMFSATKNFGQIYKKEIILAVHGFYFLMSLTEMYMYFFSTDFYQFGLNEILNAKKGQNGSTDFLCHGVY